MIAYAALQVSPYLVTLIVHVEICMAQARWLLCDVDDWCIEDEIFDHRVFFDFIVDILNDDDPAGHDILEAFSK